jgi:hypothetical protein
MTSCACISDSLAESLLRASLPSSGKFLRRSFCRVCFALSSSVRSAGFLGWLKNLWKTRKLTPETHTARDRSSEALSTPLCWMSCHSLAGSSRGCGSGSVGSGRPSLIFRGSVCLGPWGLSTVGVESLTAMLVRLRLSVDLALLAGVSFGVSGAAGAASSRARALVDRRGSVMTGCSVQSVSLLA